MGGCCSGFHVRKTEGVSLHQTQNSIHTLSAMFIRVNGNEQSDAPASNSQVSAPLNSGAASNSIQSDNIVTLAPSVLLFDGDTRIIDSKGDKSSGLQCEGRSTVHCIESELKFSYKKPDAEVACAYGSSEDKDVCPTCLDEYDPENPRIVLQCSHSYHLGCIYEWMERSANCPICGKTMIFDEAA
ncbi:hypothetical protein V6N13_105349 [Hibiscus sabdariffa]|uniref:RING-type E3 ubiquitin transferase n=1 Tax=Hibiscus sabdariffa TaxID=183260 RepID=A0ABR2EWL6_9ROSI